MGPQGGYCCNTYRIIRRFTGQEELWSNNVSGAVGDEEHGGNRRLLGKASDVRRDETQRDGDAGREGTQKKNTNPSSPLVVLRQCNHQDHAHKGESNDYDHGDDSTFLEVRGCQADAAQGGDLKQAARRTEEQSIQVTEAETIDDNAAELFFDPLLVMLATFQPIQGESALHTELNPPLGMFCEKL